MKIAIVAGEHSGDILGAGLMTALAKRYPDAQFYGIGGPKMLAEGFNSLYPMHQLSVFGLFEVLKHLPGLLKIRKQLTETLLQDLPDVFIGIDAPDFNLKLERDLHQKGIKTVHYVSPTVWAWRPKRIKKLEGVLNALLCIFPFEETYFKDKSVPAFFIGHPLADKLNKIDTTINARKQFGFSDSDTVLTLMPGSRMGEINRHAAIFIEAARLCQKQLHNLKILVPMPDEATKDCFETVLKDCVNLERIQIQHIAAENMILASDIVLAASGTATLEIMLLKKPMVVAYKLSALTAWVIRTFSLLKVPFVSMPNLIAGKQLVPEFLQEEATAKNLSEQIIKLLSEPEKTKAMLNSFDVLNKQLTCDADMQAAEIVSKVIEDTIEAR